MPHKATIPLTLAIGALVLTACVSTPEQPPPPAASGSADPEPVDDTEGAPDSGPEDSHDTEARYDADPDVAAAREAHEAPGPTARLAITYDGGVWVLDATTLEVVGDFPLDGFTRLNPAGDGRHLFITEGGSFRVLDAGTWSVPHGNHDHSYTTEPFLSDQRIEGAHPGHVVTHAGTTALYFDGAGQIDLLDPHALDVTSTEAPATRSIEVAEPHHGVAALLSDGSLLETVGTQDSRSGARVVAADGTVTAQTDDCPGVHGEAVAEHDVFVLGCQDGLVILRDGEFLKVDSPDEYGRIGNLAGTDLSPIVLGDYKTDPDAALERPERVSLTDTSTGELNVLDLGTTYTFRSLGRGPQGEALVLGADGALHVIDPGSAQVSTTVPVVAPWEEPEQWQLPRPALLVIGQFGYVTEPATQQVHLIDLDTMRVIDSITLPSVPNEISGADGRHHDTQGRGAHEGHDHDAVDHDHDDHSHDDQDGHDHDDHDHGDHDEDHDH